MENGESACSFKLSLSWNKYGNLFPMIDSDAHLLLQLEDTVLERAILLVPVPPAQLKRERPLRTFVHGEGEGRGRRGTLRVVTRNREIEDVCDRVDGVINQRLR